MGPSFLFRVLKFPLMTVMKHQYCPTHSGEATILATHPSPPFVVQLLSHVQLCDPMEWSTPGFPVLHYLQEFAQTHVHRVGDTIHCLILCHPLLLLPSIFPSFRVFSNELAFYIRWPEHWSFSFSISASSEYSGLISFRIAPGDFFLNCAWGSHMLGLPLHSCCKPPLLGTSPETGFMLGHAGDPDPPILVLDLYGCPGWQWRQGWK